MVSRDQYRLILEKARKQKNKDLVLIDVEKLIPNSEEYLKKLNKYCKKHNRTIQFWNKTLSEIPKYDFPNQLRELELPTITNIDLLDVDKLFYGKEKDAILGNFQEGLVSGIITGALYYDINGCAWLYFGLDNENRDRWITINVEIDSFLKTLKKIKRQLILFGNPDSVSLIQTVLNAYSIPNELDSEFQASLNPVK